MDSDDFMTLDIQHLSSKLSNEEYWIKRKQYLNSWTGKVYSFNNEQDIVDMINQLMGEAKDVDIFPVTYIYDPKRMIELGLYPVSIKLNAPWVIDWLNGLDNDSINFWGFYPNIPILQKELWWKYKTLKRLKEEAVENASSIPLMLVAPELIYKESRRPKTDMSIFRNSLSMRTSRNNIINNKILINNEIWNVIPVTRYAKGMSKGLYYNEEYPKDTCGTFYYYEPESTTYLAYQTELRVFNKTDGMRKLGLLDLSDTNTYDIAYEMDMHMNGYYPKDLMMTPAETTYKYRFRHGYDEDGEDLEYYLKAQNLPKIKHYAGEYLGLYAEEDKFDQPLCNGARKLQYHIVILENMVGSFQIVTEILDTRSREDSFKSLIYIVD